MRRPVFPINLHEVGDNVFLVIGHVRALLTGHRPKNCDDEVVVALGFGAGKTKGGVRND